MVYVRRGLRTLIEDGYLRIRRTNVGQEFKKITWERDMWKLKIPLKMKRKLMTPLTKGKRRKKFMSETKLKRILMNIQRKWRLAMKMKV